MAIAGEEGLAISCVVVLELLWLARAPPIEPCHAKGLFAVFGTTDFTFAGGLDGAITFDTDTDFTFAGALAGARAFATLTKRALLSEQAVPIPEGTDDSFFGGVTGAGDLQGG